MPKIYYIDSICWTCGDPIKKKVMFGKLFDDNRCWKCAKQKVSNTRSREKKKISPNEYADGVMNSIPKSKKHLI